MTTSPLIPFEAVLIEAILTSDTRLLQDCIDAATEVSLHRAMLSALHGRSARCVQLLIPYCDLDSTIAYVEWRNNDPRSMVQVEPEFLSMLLAVRDVRDVRVLLQSSLADKGAVAEDRQRCRV